MTYSVCEHHANPHGNTTRSFFSLLLGLPLFLTLGTFVHLGIGVAASAAEPELIERLPGAIDEHKVEEEFEGFDGALNRFFGFLLILFGALFHRRQ